MNDSQKTPADSRQSTSAEPDPTETPAPTPQMTEEDEEVIRKRLQELGYIE